ncbi:MAG: hypothetical protein QOE68_549, partial [Thermoanaerobaculia bacterium]|nr:hypothetical protein [Thermoanaerobaculia bacterium]
VIPLITDSKEYFKARYPLQTEPHAKAASDAIFAPLAELADLLATQLTRHTDTHIRALYGRDAPPIAGAPVANAIFERTLVFPVTAHDESTGADATILLTAILVPAIHGGPGLSLRFAGATFEAPLGEDWIFKASLGSASSLSLWWIKGQGIRIDAPAQTAVQVEIALAPDPDRTPLALSIADNTRFEIADVSLKLSANAREIDARATIHNAALIVGKEKSDSFSGSKLPANGARGTFDLEIGLSSVRGFYIGGTAGLTATIPLNSDLGPLHLDTLTIDVRPDSAASAIRVKAGLALSLKVGPVTAVVDGIGMRLTISFPETGANLGIVDFAPAFQPPSGLGIVIKAGPVSGGGYIYYDEPSGRYSGVLQLEIRGIAIKAVGILDTKLPGGGYSFLIIMSGEFSPIQLGMGFTLNGVGGLAGINRTVAIAAMQAGIRNHAADAVLFPKDPVKNAPRIISDLQRFFPPLKEHYIFGPTALIGWGSPTPLLAVKLGIILEFPPPLRIVLLGQLDCKLPDATAIVDLHVDILGVIDFSAKTFALDGVIHDSRVGPYALYGDFAVRLRWGSEPTFALSIGGFNPHFHQIPAGFPTLRRITIALSEGGNPRLTMQCYLALTSNSLQLGARAELYAEADGFNVSGWIGFDALVYFHPFGFRVDLSAGFRLRRGSKSLGGIQVDATLTGPSPWHVWGDASISILWFDVSVSFDVTIGSGGPGALPSRDVWAALLDAIQTGGNWSAVLPPSAAQVVTLRQPFDPTPDIPGVSSTPGLLIDPVGTITLVERTAPLARMITRFADASPGGTVHRFDLDQVTINTKSVNGWTLTQELFAPAPFEQLSDDQKLSRP